MRGERVQTTDWSVLARDRVVAVHGPDGPYDCGEKWPNDGDYLVIHFESGATLYVDSPALYVDEVQS